MLLHICTVPKDTSRIKTILMEKKCKKPKWLSGEALQSENARSWEALGEARPGQSSLSVGALRYRTWAQSWTRCSPRGNPACRGTFGGRRKAVFCKEAWLLGPKGRRERS